MWASLREQPHWALGDELLHMIRRQAPDAPVRAGPGAGDGELLRLTCSLANEIVEAQTLGSQKAHAAMHHAYVRYARALALVPKECEQTWEQALSVVNRA